MHVRIRQTGDSPATFKVDYFCTGSRQSSDFSIGARGDKMPVANSHRRNFRAGWILSVYLAVYKEKIGHSTSVIFMVQIFNKVQMVFRVGKHQLLLR